MTVTSTSNKTGRIVGDNLTVAFSFTFPIQSEDQLEVYKIDTTTEVPTLQTITTDYTVTINPSTEGGTVTYVVAPTTGEYSFIKRVLELDQQTDFPTESNFPEVQSENGLDYSRMIDIQLQEEIDRCLKFSDTSAQSGKVVDDLIANKALIVSADGNTIEMSTNNYEDAEAATEADLAAVEADLASVESDLASVESDLASVESDAAATAADLVSVESDLASVETDLLATEGDSTATAADLVSVESDLASVETDLLATEGDSTATAADLVSVESDLLATEADLTATEADLAATEADVAGINLPSFVANKRGSFIVQNDADDGYDFLGQGAANTFLRSNGDDALPTWESIASGAIADFIRKDFTTTSEVTVIDGAGGVVFDSTYPMYWICGEIKASNDVSYLNFEITDDAGVSYKTGAADYRWNSQGHDSSNVSDSAVDNSDDSMPFLFNVGGMGNDTGEVMMFKGVIGSPSATDTHKIFKLEAALEEPTPNSQWQNFTGIYVGAVSAINGFRIVPSAGTITGWIAIGGFNPT